MIKNKRQQKSLKILISAGPTREPIDPVRFISNYSTGVFGYTIAQEATRRGHRVILVSGPTKLQTPPAVSLVAVETAQQMQQQLNKRLTWCDCLIMSAAICDFRLQNVAGKKIKRTGPNRLLLKLQQNPDILTLLARKSRRLIEQTNRKGIKLGPKPSRLLVGFALETENLRQNALDKLVAKDLDLIVATQITAKRYPFGQTKIDALIINRDKHLVQIRQASKRRLAKILLSEVEKCSSRQSGWPAQYLGPQDNEFA